MARIAKSEVHAALRRAADHLIDAGGPDQRVSRADVKTKLSTLEGVERALTDLFFRFVDHRDYEPHAVVTVTDVEEAYAYATEKLIDDYDANDNGLSEFEIAKMSTIGKLAVTLALELAEPTCQIRLGDLQPDFVESELAALCKGLTLASEIDSIFEPIVVPISPTAGLDIDTVRRLFADLHDELCDDVFASDPVDNLELAHAEQRAFGEWFVQRRMPEDFGDPFAVELAVRTGELVDYIVANVAEPQIFAFSDQVADEDGEDERLVGTVSVFILGRTPDSWLIGVFATSVEY